MLNESVIKLLKIGMWDLATCANGEPNVVPVAFKDVTDDGKLVVGAPILQNICHWSGIFYKEDAENKMMQCKKCDYHR